MFRQGHTECNFHHGLNNPAIPPISDPLASSLLFRWLTLKSWPSRPWFGSQLHKMTNAPNRSAADQYCQSVQWTSATSRRQIRSHFSLSPPTGNPLLFRWLTLASWPTDPWLGSQTHRGICPAVAPLLLWQHQDLDLQWSLWLDLTRLIWLLVRLLDLTKERAALSPLCKDGLSIIIASSLHSR